MAEELKRREEQDREAAERAAREEEEAKRAAEVSPQMHKDEQQKQALIKRIMRDDALSQQEKQLRVQAILAGKVEVASMAAMYDAAPPAQPVAAAAQRSAVALQRQQHQQPQPTAERKADAVPAAAVPARGQPGMAAGYGMGYPAASSQVKLDVEAVALSAMGSGGMGIDEDDIMAMVRLPLSAGE